MVVENKGHPTLVSVTPVVSGDFRATTGRTVFGSDSTQLSAPIAQLRAIRASFLLE